MEGKIRLSKPLCRRFLKMTPGADIAVHYDPEHSARATIDPGEHRSYYSNRKLCRHHRSNTVLFWWSRL